MRRILTKVALVLTICFSLFCFSYLNTQPNNQIAQTDTSQLVKPDVTPDQDSDEMFLPDLAIIEKIALIVKRVSKVF